MISFIHPLLKSGTRRSPRRVKSPPLLQMEAVECGAAALGIVLAHYGRIVPLAELRVECGVSRDGSSAGHLLKAAQRYGLIAKGYKFELEQVLFVPPPYIVFWNFNHFLVVEGYSRKRFYLNDPASGPRSVSVAEFDQAFTGVVLTFEPGDDFQPHGQKPSLLLSLANWLKGSTAAISYCILAGLLLVIPGITLPVFSQVFVDYILVENRTDWLRPLVLGMGLMAMLQMVLTVLQLRYLRHLRVKLAMGMSSRFLWHLLRLPVRFYGQRFAGEISRRLQINSTVAETLSGQLATTVISLVMVVFYAGVMLAYDRLLTLIGIGFAVANMLSLQWVNRHRVQTNMRLAKDVGKVTGVAIAGLQSIETLKASALESDFFARWSGYYSKGINTQQEMEVANQTLGVLPSLLNAIATLLVLGVGGWRVMDGKLSIGMLIAFQGLMHTLLEPVTNLLSFGSTLQTLEGDLNRLDDVLRNPVDPLFSGKSDALPPLQGLSSVDVPLTDRLRGSVELRHVTFGYSPVDPPLIEDFSLSLTPGQRVAIVGQSGSGKSTIAKLLCGLYQPWRGEIMFDGLPRADLPRSVLVNSLAMIEQDIFLFSGSLRDNLTLWNPHIPEAQVIQACEDAMMSDVIRAIPGGLDGTLLEGGANLSGGQRQRLEIARALVNNPVILVMDEATSALDPETEYQVNEQLRQRGCTCIIMAHRLSTIRDCDEIIVLEQGRVVQRGTHEQLQQRDGVYAHLIRSEEGA